jgi:DNA polymerase-3 subunit chi
MVDGIELPLADAATSGYEKFLDMFDGTDAAQLEAARKRWSAYKEAGHSLVYWKQNAKGGWEEGART